MKEILYENEYKVYVKVEAHFYPDGQVLPVALWWEDGRRYTVDRVLDVCRAASLKAGGLGIRYSCRVHSKHVYLFYEDGTGRWFMERKEVV